MNLHRLLQQRAVAGQPVRVGLIGAGKFGSMFLSQVPTLPGLEIAVIADLNPERAAACRTVRWDAAQIARTAYVASGIEAGAHPAVEIVVEATCNPTAGITHARAAIAAGKHIVMSKSKSAIEMVATANATGLAVPSDGLRRRFRKRTGRSSTSTYHPKLRIIPLNDPDSSLPEWPHTVFHRRSRAGHAERRRIARNRSS